MPSMARISGVTGLEYSLVSLPSQRVALLVNADVAVRVNEARRDDAARRVDDLRARRNVEILPHRDDFAAVDEHLSICECRRL